MTEQEYRAFKACNWSSIKLALTSGLAYQHGLANPVKPTPAMRFGTELHAAVLEPQTWQPVTVPGEFLTASGARSTKKEAADWFAANPDALTEAEVANIRDCASMVRAHPEVDRVLAVCPNREQPIFWTDQQTGLECKAKPDAYGRYLLDVKTTSCDWTPRGFANEILSRKYHGQLAFYAEGLAANGVHVEQVGIIFVQNSAPWDVALVWLGDDWLQAGAGLVRKALAEVQLCQDIGATGAFPAAVELELPKWA